MPIEIPKDKWPGSVRKVTIGRTRRRGRHPHPHRDGGRQKTMPYHAF